MKKLSMLLLLLLPTEICFGQSLQQLIRGIGSKGSGATIDEIGSCSCLDYDEALELVNADIDFDSLVTIQLFDSNYFSPSKKRLPIGLIGDERETFRARNGELVYYSWRSPNRGREIRYRDKRAVSYTIDESIPGDPYVVKWEYDHDLDGKLKSIRSFLNDSLTKISIPQDFTDVAERSVENVFVDGRLVSVVNLRHQERNEFKYKNDKVIQIFRFSSWYGLEEITWFDGHGLITRAELPPQKFVVEYFYTFDLKGRWVTRERYDNGKFHNLTIRRFYQ